MCSSEDDDPVAIITSQLGVLDSRDLPQASDKTARDELLRLLTAQNMLAAQVVRRVADFDQRGLAPNDAQKTTKTWLQAFGRFSGHDAQALTRASRPLDLLPALAAAFTAGEVSLEHVNQIRKLHDKEDDEVLRKGEEILVKLAMEADPDAVHRACDYIQRLVHEDDDPHDPDGSAATFAKRQVTLSRLGELWRVFRPLCAATRGGL